MDELQLSEDEADAIGELFNIGMGQAAASLSSMVGEEVALSVPALNVSNRARIAEELEPRPDVRVCAVREAFSGPFAGEALLIFTEPGGMALVRRLVPVDPGAETPGEVEQDALTEIGNIILNGCLASFSNLIHSELEGGVPDYRSGRPAQLIGAAADPVLSVRIDIGVGEGDAQGQALFLLDISSIDAFREAIRRVLVDLG